ncbi:MULTISPECIES: hypothetical protein [unclassified Pseudomonas]|uniref:hypothetical protein n=1 Tax=unclassified Pseudomonas TaxID=196821 RepID=UPI0025D82656|nr:MULTISPECIES: hypothetical protein [unclassified Pseudomonas]
MHDSLTIAYNGLIQNQIELTSTLTSIIDEASLRGVPSAHINDLRRRMESFESQLNALSKRLMERHDGLRDHLIDRDQPGTAST